MRRSRLHKRKENIGKPKSQPTSLRLLLGLPLQIPIKPGKSRAGLAKTPKPRKRPRHDTTKLLSMSESRPAGRDGTGLEAEEMVAVEEERYAPAPFELRRGILLQQPR